MFASDYIFGRSDFGHFFRLEFESAVSSDTHTHIYNDGIFIYHSEVSGN